MTHDDSAAEVVLKMRSVRPDVTQGRCRRSAPPHPRPPKCRYPGFHMENPRPLKNERVPPELDVIVPRVIQG